MTAPPRLPLRFFRWFCHPDYREDIEGDLLERFEKRVQQSGVRKARWFFLLEIALMIRPELMRGLNGIMLTNFITMFRTNIKIAYRNLLKQKAITLTNVIGLSVSISVCLLILIFVQYQFSFDRFFENSDRIYRMVVDQKSPEGTDLKATVPYQFAEITVNDFAEVEAATIIAGPFNNQLVYVEDSSGKRIGFVEKSVMLADNNFLSVFKFKMLRGDRGKALSEPNSVVLTESTARRYFGDTDPLGKFISVSGRSSIVSGVCEDPPPNSHFEFSYLVSSTSVAWLSGKEFNLNGAYCYLLLRKGVDPQSLEEKLPELTKKYVAAEIERLQKISWQEYQAAGFGFTYSLQPLVSFHLAAKKYDGMKPGGNIVAVKALITVAVFIFIIAFVNFVNLSTARSGERAREIGIKKVMGANNSQLVTQMLTESLIVSAGGVLLGLIVTLFALPHFNRLAEVPLSMPTGLHTAFILVGITVLVGLLAGIYPAMIITGYNPARVLAGSFSINSKRSWMRGSLVVVQFWISIVLVTGSIVMQKQMGYMGARDLGFDKELMGVIEGAFNMDPAHTRPFIDEVRSIPGVKGVAGTLWVQGFQRLWSDQYHVEHSSVLHSINRVLVGDGLPEVMNFRLMEGDFFSADADDSKSVLLNISAVKKLGISNPVGKKIVMMSGNGSKLTETPFTIKGVIEDFNYQSLHHEIEPLVVQSNEVSSGRMSYIVVKLGGADIGNVLTQIEQKWTQTIPERPFKYRFLDDVLDAEYRTDQKLGLMFLLFSTFSIFISCIGLLSLSAYTISLRAKEIGIRKIMGASVSRVLLLLSSGYLKMVMGAFVLALPLAWYLADFWLNNFAYRAALSWELFLISPALILLVVFVTIGFQTFRIAKLNPVEVLRNNE